MTIFGTSSYGQRELGYEDTGAASGNVQGNTTLIVAATVVGDGVGFYMLEGWVTCVSSQQAAGGEQLGVYINDSVLGIQTYQLVTNIGSAPTGGAYESAMSPQVRVAAWSGPRVISLRLYGSVNTPWAYFDPTYPAFIRVFRA
jgi:hypothetical protein